MKDIEQKLSAHTPEPSRPLRDDFTAAVIAELRARPGQAGAYTRLSRLRSRLLTRVGMLSLAGGIFLACGTAMAVAVWPAPSVTRTVTQELPSGNHIVGYDLKDCDYFDKLGGAMPANTDDKVYYEIRQSSKLTDEQLQSALQGYCEDTVSGRAVSAAMKQLPGGSSHGDFSTETLTVNAITRDSITVSLDSQYAPGMHQVQPDLTYTQFAKNLLVYDQLNRADYSDIHAGDAVTMIMHQNTNPQDVLPNYYVAENDPGNLTILAIVKVPALTADPSAILQLWGGDIVRLDPCTTSPTGFCRAYDFTPQATSGSGSGSGPKSGWQLSGPASK